MSTIAAILHDLGLTERHGGERRFDVDGAEAATRRSPAAYALTWLADTTNRCCGTSLPTFDSLLRRDPFAMAAG
jgi:hypothetical protein